MMKQPAKLWEQYVGKAKAEAWRGSGCWPAQPYQCELEPPWEPYDRRTLTQWCCYVNDWNASYYGGHVVRYTDDPLGATPTDTETTRRELMTIRVEQFQDDESTMPLTDQLLHSLLTFDRPAAFELVGCGDTASIVTQYTCDTYDHEQFDRQLSIHFPNSAVVSEPAEELLGKEALLSTTEGAVAGQLSLDQPYCFPLRNYQYLNPDPITVAIAAMERLEPSEWAVMQVLWQPARSPWQSSLMDAIANPYKPGDYYVALERDEIRGMQEKFASPLFAVSIRLAASSVDVFRHLIGWADQLTNSPLQRFEVNIVEDNETTWLDYALTHRCTFRPGMILNANELASLAHLPRGVPSERLKKVATRTRPTTVAASDGSVVLGENTHRGKTVRASIPAHLRSRHCYIAGASGTGKSTLLLNMMVQDIHAGQGIGLLDPHGDLVNALLPRIPIERVNDVILFDPTDHEYPFALNILSARDQDERERIVDETIMSMQRYFPASWGPRLERILTFAIKGVLDADKNATLIDVERMLVDKEFRLTMGNRMSNDRYRRFWLDEFPKYGPTANDPVLNKLSVFIEKRLVRNIVCQRKCAVDFDDVINNRKIFIANLSTGLLMEGVANILGSFVITKVVNAAFRRANLPVEQRLPWYLYVDEFQNFMGVSIGFERILAEARKYNLCLAGLANQYVGQLTPSVRQAIFGNIGVMVTFRLGVEDANTIAREMGVFTAEEILNLELGEAIARAGGSKTAFNLRTFPDPPLAEPNSTDVIRERMHAEFTMDRNDVEREFLRRTGGATIAETGQAGATNAPNDSQKYRLSQTGPTDPNEDDLL